MLSWSETRGSHPESELSTSNLTEQLVSDKAKNLPTSRKTLPNYFVLVSHIPGSVARKSGFKNTYFLSAVEHSIQIRMVSHTCINATCLESTGCGGPLFHISLGGLYRKVPYSAQDQKPGLQCTPTSNFGG